MNITLDHLNPAQREAVEHVEGPLLIFAGAGSGKTRALTHRIANLISNHGVDPKSILAVTFTNKAAKEMKERIQGLSGAGALGQMWVGTFHSVCARMLREQGPKIGLDTNFVIYDDDDQTKLIRECLEQLGIDEKENNARQILSKISSAKEQLVLPPDYATVFAGSYDQVVGRVYPLYQQKLKASNALDFDDLIMYAVRLLDERQEV
ncbi:MAG: ATP-dependent helicase, partial [Armatimonadota bacterium]